MCLISRRVDWARPRKIVYVEITFKRPSSDRSFHHTLGKFSKDNNKREHESKLKGLKATSRTRNLPLQLSLVNSFLFLFFFFTPVVISVVMLSLLNLPNSARRTSARSKEEYHFPAGEKILTRKDQKLNTSRKDVSVK